MLNLAWDSLSSQFQRFVIILGDIIKEVVSPNGIPVCQMEASGPSSSDGKPPALTPRLEALERCTLELDLDLPRGLLAFRPLDWGGDEITGPQSSSSGKASDIRATQKNLLSTKH